MENPFKLEQLTHLVLAQYHRWYQVYEIPFTANTISNQKDILSNDIEIISQNGTTKGKDGLEDRLKVYTGWQNAHHVKNSTVTVSDDGTLSLEADILYQNIRPDNSRYSYTLHYSTQLKQRENDLPLFTKITLQPTGVVEEFKFEEAYIENRVKSFLHFWLYLMECPDVERFKELLDKNFVLHLSSGTIADFDSFKNWVTSNAARIKTSTHQYKHLEIHRGNDDTTINVKVKFEWKGITVDNKKMIAETSHEWILSNDTEKRFSQMKEMNVTVIKPFQVVDDF